MCPLQLLLPLLRPGCCHRGTCPHGPPCCWAGVAGWQAVGKGLRVLPLWWLYEPSCHRGPAMPAAAGRQQVAKVRASSSSSSVHQVAAVSTRSCNRWAGGGGLEGVRGSGGGCMPHAQPAAAAATAQVVAVWRVVQLCGDTGVRGCWGKGSGGRRGCEASGGRWWPGPAQAAMQLEAGQVVF